MNDEQQMKQYIDGFAAGTELLRLNTELYRETAHLSDALSNAVIYGARVMNDKCRAALRALPSKDAEEIAREYAEAHQEDLKRQFGMALVGLVRCPKCGKVVPDIDFCGKCGADMRETEVLK